VIRLPLPPHTGQSSSEAFCTPTFCGKSTARPAISIQCRRSGTMRVVAAGCPVRNWYIAANVSGEVADSTCVWFGTVTFVAPPIDRPGAPAPAQIASVGTPPGGEAACCPSMLT
jgi:hypothetical protein